MKQEYALKEYVSENNYGKIINGSSSEILTNCNLTGDEAEAKIVALFGSIDLFKSCVQDMLDNHTRYFYHTEGGADSCKEINGLAWKNADTYELDFLYEYWTSGIPYTKKVVLQVADSNNTRIAIIEDISTDKSLEQKFTPSEKRLESNSDLNDYKTQGSWWESSTATLNTIANKPVERVGEAVLQVFSCGNNYKLQVFYNITQNLVFTRAYQADHWTSWKDCSGNVTQGGDGVIEIGRYIDFHKDFDSNSSDYTCRLQDDSDTPRQVILPSEGGTIALTKDINWDNIQSTIRFSNEFNFCDDSQGDYCWINYRGKSGNTTSADKLFIGNGQSNGGYGALVTTHYDHPSNQQMYLGSKSNNSWIRCQDICCLDGEVGDGIWSIRTNGNAQFQRVASVNGFFKESDKRLKSNIQPLNHTIEQICAIPTDKFVMNGHIQIGTIAQDLENIVPEIVSEDYKLASEVSNKEEFEIIERKDKERVEEYIKVKKVEYEMLGVLAIEGIKLLKQEIDKLNNRIKELENGRDSDVKHD